MMDVQFNTGRGYTAEGQIIRAIAQPTGVVQFTDHSRGIAGQIKSTFDPTDQQPWDLAVFVMEHYDRHNYSMVPMLPRTTHVAHWRL